VVNHNLKVSTSARRVSDVNAICKETDILNKDEITLTDVTLLTLTHVRISAFLRIV
jgi:hypothetical protein